MSVLNYFIQQASQKGFVIEAVKMIIASLVPALSSGISTGKKPWSNVFPCRFPMPQDGVVMFYR